MARRNLIQWLGLSILPWMSLAAPAHAETIELKIYPDNSVDARCPTQVTAYQTVKPYQEGGFSRDGMIVLDAIATDIALTTTSPFSATWTGTLKPEFRACRGTAGIFRYDNQPFQGHSYIRMQFLSGKVFAILDMTGVSDTNNFTSIILYQGMRDNNPRWTWGGTD